MMEVMAVIEQLAQRDKMEEINTQDIVYSLNDETGPKIKKFLRHGETKITEIELSKRRKERCINKIFMTKLNRLVVLAKDRQEEFKDAHQHDLDIKK